MDFNKESLTSITEPRYSSNKQKADHEAGHALIMTLCPGFYDVISATVDPSNDDNTKVKARTIPL